MKGASIYGFSLSLCHVSRLKGYNKVPKTDHTSDTGVSGVRDTKIETRMNVSSKMQCNRAVRSFSDRNSQSPCRISVVVVHSVLQEGHAGFYVSIHPSS